MNQAKLKDKAFLRTSENQKILCIVQLPEGRIRSKEERWVRGKTGEVVLGQTTKHHV